MSDPRVLDLRDSSPRYFFLHLQKTAGTSLIWRIRRAVADEAFYPNDSDGDMWHDGPQMSITQLERRWQARGDEIRVVAGHFPLAVTEVLGGGFTTFTVLRDPVDRTLSFLRHFSAHSPDAHGRSPEELYQDPFIRDTILRNHMVKMIAMTREEMTAGVLTPCVVDAAHLDRAIERLHGFVLVGVAEQFEAFCDELSIVTGWDLGESVVSNQTEHEPVPHRLREAIEADNQADRALYDYAITQWGHSPPSGSQTTNGAASTSAE